MARTAARLSAVLSLAVLALAGLGLTTSATARADQASPRFDANRINFDSGWQFALVAQNSFTQTTADPGNVYSGAPTLGYSTSFSGSAWRAVTLPQDWSIELPPTNSTGANACATCTSSTAWRPGGFAWYRKTFSLPMTGAPATAGDVYSVDFNGSFGLTTVYLNGAQVGTRELSGYTHDYGFTGFRVDLPVGTGPGQPGKLDPNGPNVLAVNVSNTPDSHYYKGSGLYGDVWFTESKPVHIPRYGVFVTTPDLETTSAGAHPYGNVQVQTQVTNETSAPTTATVRSTVTDAQGSQVATGQSASPLTIAAGNVLTDTSTLQVVNPKLWSPDSPNLYSVRTDVLGPIGQVLDSYVSPLGFRWVKMDPNTGFSINGVPTRLNGVDLHSDKGAMGQVQNYDSVYRDLSILKAGGINTIRTSHNPPQWTFFAAAEKLGMMVEDEFADGWGKNAYSAALFNPDSDTDIADMVMAERNSPAVMFWSLGNEPSQASTSAGLPIIQRLEADVRALDPTRRITWEPLILNLPAQGSATDTNISALPTALHYLGPERFDSFHEQYPNNAFWEGEATNQATVLGVYDACDQVVGASSNQIATQFAPGGEGWQSSCDNSAGNGPNGFKNAGFSLKNGRDRLWLSGIWPWTGFDYLGEANPGTFPSMHAPFGLVAMTGVPKDPYYLVKSQWTTAPMVHVVPMNWTDYKPGQNVTVLAYSNQKNVDLKVVDPDTGALIKDFGVRSFVEKTTPDGRKYLESNVARGDNPSNVAPAATTLRFPAAAGDKVVYPVSVTGYGDHKEQVNLGGANPESFTADYDFPTLPAATSLVAGADGGASNIKVASFFGFQPGEQFKIDANTPNEETATVSKVGSAAMSTTLAAPAHAGDKAVYLESTTNLRAGDTLTLDTGAGQESLPVTQVGNAAGTTATTLATAIGAGANTTTLKLASTAGLTYGDTLLVDGASAGFEETKIVSLIGTAGSDGTGVGVYPALNLAHASGVPVRDLGPGTAVTLGAPLQSAHAAGAAVNNTNGTGITFSPALTKPHANGAPVLPLGAGLRVTDVGGLRFAHAAGDSVTSPGVVSSSVNASCVGSYEDTNGTCGDIKLLWNVPFTPGKLVATAGSSLDDGGNVVSTASDSETTAGSAATISVKPEKRVIPADGVSLSFVDLDVVDARGVTVPQANNEISIAVSGPGKLVGMDNAEAFEPENMKASSRAAFMGKALAIIQSTGGSGPIVVTASSPGLSPQSATVVASNATGGDAGADTTVVRSQLGKPIVLPSTVRVEAADGSASDHAVTWGAVPSDASHLTGTYTVTGNVSGSSVPATALVTVYSVAGVNSYSTVVGAGDAPTLPSYLNVNYSDGISVLQSVTWAAVAPSVWANATPGSTIPVQGAVAGVPGGQQPVATVRVASSTLANLALGSLTPKPGASVSYTTVNASPAQMIDGTTDSGGWANTSGSAASADGGDWAAVTWRSAQLIKSLNVYFTVSATRSTPNSTTSPIEIDRWDGRDYVPAAYDPFTYSQSSTTPTTITLSQPTQTSRLRLRMASSAPLTSGGWIQVQELQAMGDQVTLSSNAALSDLRLNGQTVPGFDPARTSYDVASKVYPPVITATAADNGTTAITLPQSLPGTATVTVTSEDGTQTRTYTLNITDVLAGGGVGGTVPATLSLSLGTPAAFGTFTPGTDGTYTASTTATVVSTAGDGALSVSDPDTAHPGHLVNGPFALAQAVQAKATSPAGVGNAFAPVAATPTTLMTYVGPVSNDPVAITFQQSIAKTDPLRTGSYSKTLTFTLSTTNP